MIKILLLIKTNILRYFTVILKVFTQKFEFNSIKLKYFSYKILI